MEQSFISKIITLLNEGIDNYNFNIILFKYIDDWKDITYLEVQSIMNEIKYNGLALYTFLPFFYKFIGIDLYTYYKQISESKNWDKDKIDMIIADFKLYPNEFYGGEIEIDLKEYNLILKLFSQIRSNLIRQGAVGVEKVHHLGKGWLYFKDI